MKLFRPSSLLTDISDCWIIRFRMIIVVETHEITAVFLYFAFALFLSFFLFSISINAQESLGIDPTFKSGDRREQLLDDSGKEAPAPEISTPSPTESEVHPNQKTQLGPSIHVYVKHIRTIGNKVYSNEELALVTKPFVNRNLDSDDLERVRRRLTLFYIQNGYVNSGAVLPDQTLSDGVVTFLIIEGSLTEVNVAGNRWLRDGYYTRRIDLSSGPPLNINDLGQSLQMLQQQEMIKRLHAELKPGLKAGQSILDLNVDENVPFSAWTTVNNYQSPSVGAERGLVNLAWRSLTKIGDVVNVTYGRSEGLDPLFDLTYRVPFTPWDTELGLRYRANDFDIIEEPFKNLDIESESEIFEVTLRQPFWRSPSREFAVGVIGERLRSQSWLLGDPFSFSSGTVDGEAIVSALRFSQEYLYRSRRQVIAIRSRFSWGLDTLDATRHSSAEPDGQFFTWLGQFQWAAILSFLDIQTIFRTDIQLADDPLLALEQLPVGGRYSVRGYRENQLVRDNAAIGSLETRIPIAKGHRWADYVQLAPFFDIGKSWNSTSSTPDPEVIYSVGIGLRWAMTFSKDPFSSTLELEAYWGNPLEEIDSEGNGLQDDGIHFQLTFSAF